MAVIRSWDEKVTFELIPETRTVKFRNVGAEPLTWKVLFFVMCRLLKAKIIGR